MLCFFCLAYATAADARKVQVAVATFSQSVLPFAVAQEKGYYREEDLDVELILMTASVANMALMGGNVDLSPREERHGRHHARCSTKICFYLF